MQKEGSVYPIYSFAVANFNVTAGNLWEWHENTDWVEVPGSEMPGPNRLVVSDDGALLAAGQYAPVVTDIVSCLGGSGCDGVSTRVARITPNSLTAQQLLDYPSDENLILGTAAIEVGDEIWVGAIAGGNKISRFSL